MRIENPCCKGIHAKSTIMKSTKDLLASVKSSLDGLAFETPLVLLCSGGVDSMTLAKALFELKVEHVLFHVNYGIRGEDSVADAMWLPHGLRKQGSPFTRCRHPRISAKRLSFNPVLGPCDWMEPEHFVNRSMAAIWSQHITPMMQLRLFCFMRQEAVASKDWFPCSPFEVM